MGVFIRDKKWRQRGTGIKVADPRQDCYFDPGQEGLVEVQHRQVIDRLLAHPNDFEVAWERHGVKFDASGKVLELDTPPLILSSVSEIGTDLPIPDHPEPLVRRRGRPKKR